jgi:ABC-type antimicrobial peptide transport system permease subunit
MDFPWGTNVWAAATPPRQMRDMSYLWAVVRSPKGVGSKLSVGSSAFALKPLEAFFRPRDVVSVVALYAGSLVVLFIAWMHLGVIQTTRAIDAQRETAMRAVLGATSWGLMRRWMMEGAVLGIGGLSGAYLATPAVLRLVLVLLPPALTRTHAVSVDDRVLVYLGLLTCGGILALGCGPLMVVRQTRLTDALRGRPSGWPMFRYHRVRVVLLALQIGLATAVLYLAAVAVHDFIRVTRISVGFDVNHVVTIEVPGGEVGGGSDTVATLLKRLPFVSAVAPGSIPLLEGKTVVLVSLLKPTGPGDFRSPNALEAFAANGYLEAIGVTVTEGRDFNTTDPADVVLLSGELARRLQLPAPAVGQDVYVGGLRKRVVGVVSDIRGDGPAADPSPFVYEKASSSRYKMLLVRTSRPPTRVLNELIQTVRFGAHTNGPVRVVLASERYEAATSNLRARMTLLLSLAGCAFSLGVIGIFATTTEVLRRRARDNALRLALGQRPVGLAFNVIGHALLTTIVGGAVGLAAGDAAARLTSAFVAGKSAADPLAAAVVGLGLMGSASLASLGPALRAARSDPLRMLRDE